MENKKFYALSQETKTRITFDKDNTKQLNI